jgi:hypothetical protein
LLSSKKTGKPFRSPEEDPLTTEEMVSTESFSHDKYVVEEFRSLLP